MVREAWDVGGGFKFSGEEAPRRRSRVPCKGKLYGGFRKIGVPYLGVLIIRILLFRVLC